MGKKRYLPTGRRIRTSTKKRRRLLIQFEGRCFYCDRTMTLPGSGFPNETHVTREHLKPKSHGPTDYPGNLIAACSRCNNARATQPWWEFLAEMRTRDDVFQINICPIVSYFWPPMH